MISLGFIFIAAAAIPRGMPKVTKPAPLRSAASAHKSAAPENSRLPPITKILPKSPLWALTLLCDNRAGNRIGLHVRNRYMHAHLF
jgi:hypothetical protein